MHAYQNYLLGADELELRANEDRSSKRYPVDRSIEWPLVHATSGELFAIRVVDVSPRGLGVFTKTPILVGQRYWLRTPAFDICLEAVHCTSCLGIDNLFRGGLFLRSFEHDLLKLFHAAGLLKK